MMTFQFNEPIANAVTDPRCVTALVDGFQHVNDLVKRRFPGVFLGEAASQVEIPRDHVLT